MIRQHLQERGYAGSITILKEHLHELRHSYATISLAAGVHRKTLSKHLGLAQISITVDAYAHVMPALEWQAADHLAEVVLGA